MSNTCRCCLSGDAVESIFHKMEDNNDHTVTYSDMINAISSKRVSSLDNLPHEICSNCVSELNQAYSFRVKCDKAYDTLMLLSSSNKKPIVLLSRTDQRNKQIKDDGDVFLLQVDDDGFEVEMKDVKTIKVECDDDDNHDDGYICIEPIDDDIGDPDYCCDDVKSENVANDKAEIDNDDLPLLPNRKTSVKVQKCPVCSEKFKFKANLKNHVKVVHPEHKKAEYFCQICEKLYKNGPRHIRNKHKEDRKTFPCSLCEMVCTNANILSSHMDDHRVNGMISCKKCPKQFEKTTGYYKHIMIHQEKKHLCHICSKAFTYKYNLAEHVRSHSTERPFICPVCKKTFKRMTHRNNHFNSHTDVENLDEKTLTEYLNLKLKISQKVARRKKPRMSCNECGKFFKRRRDLTEHINKHLGIKPYYCELCDKHVSSQERHVYFHRIKNVDSTCPICDKTFSTKSTLAIHIKIHSKERPFKCDLCDSAFRQNCSLRRHKLLHTDQKNFICHFCSKPFSTKYKMSLHIRSHTKERPFVCDVCTKGFVSGNLLRVHKMRHEEARPMECNLCDKTFKTKNDLRAHLKVHQKIRKHPCRLCEKIFYRSDHRQRHERTVHSMNTEEQLADISKL